MVCLTIKTITNSSEHAYTLTRLVVKFFDIPSKNTCGPINDISLSYPVLIDVTNACFVCQSKLYL